MSKYLFPNFERYWTNIHFIFMNEEQMKIILFDIRFARYAYLIHM